MAAIATCLRQLNYPWDFDVKRCALRQYLFLFEIDQIMMHLRRIRDKEKKCSLAKKGKLRRKKVVKNVFFKAKHLNKTFLLFLVNFSPWLTCERHCDKWKNVCYNKTTLSVKKQINEKEISTTIGDDLHMLGKAQKKTRGDKCSKATIKSVIFSEEKHEYQWVLMKFSLLPSFLQIRQGKKTNNEAYEKAFATDHKFST